jgi:hypothetical protein
VTTYLNNTTSAFGPISVAKDHRNRPLIVNGIEAAKYIESSWTNALTAGVSAGVNGTFAGAWSGAGSISGVYSYAFRFVHSDGDFGDLSPVQTATASSNTTISYTNVPLDSANGGTTTAARQIFRSLPSVPGLLYLDATISDNSTTTASSTKSDATLAAQTQLPILNADGTLHARRFGVPPATKSVVCAFKDRMWMAADVIGYTVVPDATTINRIYYSEVLEPWSWPTSQNYLTISDDAGMDDVITGLMPHGSYLYFLKERHIYRLSYATVPAVDGEVYLVASRGCVNNRCWTLVEDTAYLLDYHGVYAFNGASLQPVSLPIQDYFREARINWQASKWFHCIADPREEVVRFFVALGDSYLPTGALCFNYRLNRWWTERFPFAIASSCHAPITGQTRPIYGSEYDRLLTPDSTNLDGMVDSSAQRRASVTSATWLSLSDSTITMPTGQSYNFTSPVNCHVHIVGGKGSGQSRRVISASGSKLTIKHPWMILPDATSIYQLAGVRWNVRFGQFEWPVDDGMVN